MQSPTDAGDQESSGRARAVRYAKDMTLRIKIQDGSDGNIYPPYLEITYGFASEDNYDANAKLSVSLFMFYFLFSYFICLCFIFYFFILFIYLFYFIF